LRLNNAAHGLGKALRRYRLRYHRCSWHPLFNAVKCRLLNRCGDRGPAGLPKPTGNFYSLFASFEPDIHQRKVRFVANREIKSLTPIPSKAADRIS
jgi:hypothetical protein